MAKRPRLSFLPVRWNRKLWRDASFHWLNGYVGRTITFVDVPPASMQAALADLGFPAWQADGLLEEFAMYRRGEAAGVEPGVRDALGRPPRAFAEFARDYAPLFA